MSQWLDIFLIRVFCGLLFCSLLFSSSGLAADFNMDTIVDIKKKGTEASKKLVVPNVPLHNKDAMEVFEYYQSEDYQKILQSETDRIRTFFDTGQFPALPSDTAVSAGRYYFDSAVSANKLAQDERIYLFVSSSIPMTTLKNYVYALEAANDPNIRVVFRGLLPKTGYQKNSLLQTSTFVRDLLGGDCKLGSATNCTLIKIPGGVQIDPVLFARYGISEGVPAFVYARGVHSIDNSMTEGLIKNTAVNDFYIVRGDVRLDFVLDLFQRELKSQGKNSVGLDNIVAAIIGGFYKGQ